jgi:hypothetical protein
MSACCGTLEPVVAGPVEWTCLQEDAVVVREKLVGRGGRVVGQLIQRGPLALVHLPFRQPSLREHCSCRLDAAG